MKDISNLTQEEQAAILARREYYRKWRKANKEKVKQHTANYWKKKGQLSNQAK
ncbi:MAG: phosphatase [Ruminococcus sp.]|nr:phosphatase [Ruminococcus sp.]